MTVERMSSTATEIEVLDRVLDKGIVIDASARVSLVGIYLITVEACITVASIAERLAGQRCVVEAPGEIALHGACKNVHGKCQGFSATCSEMITSTRS